MDDSFHRFQGVQRLFPFRSLCSLLLTLFLILFVPGDAAFTLGLTVVPRLGGEGSGRVLCCWPLRLVEQRRKVTVREMKRSTN